MIMASGHCFGYDSLPSKDSGTVTISLQNAADKLSKIDSVFIICDRYDLRGAGVIKQVFYPDFDNRIKICLPKGKYYMNIYCLGIYNKVAFDRIVSAKPNKNRKVFLRLQQSALFQLGLARFPDEHFDPSHLAIFHNIKK
ncbi:MAG TPA: hypothetical protein VFI33_01615 [Puia sp.]|nr:hypothetical protein [Puia sp.]